MDAHFHCISWNLKGWGESWCFGSTSATTSENGLFFDVFLTYVLYVLLFLIFISFSFHLFWDVLGLHPVPSWSFQDALSSTAVAHVANRGFVRPGRRKLPITFANRKPLLFVGFSFSFCSMSWFTSMICFASLASCPFKRQLVEYIFVQFALICSRVGSRNYEITWTSCLVMLGHFQWFSLLITVRCAGNFNLVWRAAVNSKDFLTWRPGLWHYPFLSRFLWSFDWHSETREDNERYETWKANEKQMDT